VRTEILPVIIEMAADNVSSTSLLCSVLFSCCHRHMFVWSDYFSPIIVQVPNVRFTVAKGLETVAQVCGTATCDAQIRPVLELLSEDADRDVQYYTNRALKSLEQHKEMKQ